jgi:hypothetical protein
MPHLQAAMTAAAAAACRRRSSLSRPRVASPHTGTSQSTSPACCPNPPSPESSRGVCVSRRSRPQLVGSVRTPRTDLSLSSLHPAAADDTLSSYRAGLSVILSPCIALLRLATVRGSPRRLPANSFAHVEFERVVDPLERQSAVVGQPGICARRRRRRRPRPSRAGTDPAKPQEQPLPRRRGQPLPTPEPRRALNTRWALG